MTEEWRDVVDYEGWYQVSNFGNVRSVDRYITYSNGQIRLQKGVTLKVGGDKDGYSVVCLIKNRKRKIGKVHRLVATAFLHKDSKYDQVNHLDGVKNNNLVTNLEWTNASGNQQHAVDTKLRVMPRGENSAASKLCQFDVDFIKEWIRLGFTQRDIGKAFNVHYATISCINVGKSWVKNKELL